MSAPGQQPLGRARRPTCRRCAGAGMPRLLHGGVLDGAGRGEQRATMSAFSARQLQVVPHQCPQAGLVDRHVDAAGATARRRGRPGCAGRPRRSGRPGRRSRRTPASATPPRPGPPRRSAPPPGRVRGTPRPRPPRSAPAAALGSRRRRDGGTVAAMRDGPGRCRGGPRPPLPAPAAPPRPPAGSGRPRTGPSATWRMRGSSIGAALLGPGAAGAEPAAARRGDRRRQVAGRQPAATLALDRRVGHGDRRPAAPPCRGGPAPL